MVRPQLSFVLSLLLFVHSNLFAEWTRVNCPTEREVNCFAVKGNILFAGTYYNGLFKSTDFGETWNPSGTGIPNANILCLKVFGDEILAGTRGSSGGGIYRSTDEGKSWNLVGIQYYYVYDILRVGSSYFAASSNGLFVSNDNFKSWSQCQNGLSNYGFQCLAFHNNTIFVGTYSNGVYRSTDLGNSWNACNNGLISQENPVYCFFSNGTKLFVGTKKGIFCSTDNGDNWVESNSGFSFGVPSVKCFYNFGKYIFVGTGSTVYVSDDDGENWKDVGKGLIYGAKSIIHLNDYLFAASGDGVYRRPLVEMISAVEDKSIGIDLKVHPNPFSEKAKVCFNLPESVSEVSQILLCIFDSQGDKVSQFCLDFPIASDLCFELGGMNFSQGIYFLLVKIGEIQIIKPIIRID